LQDIKEQPKRESSVDQQTEEKEDKPNDSTELDKSFPSFYFHILTEITMHFPFIMYELHVQLFLLNIQSQLEAYLTK
jgi:hypothetical protein